MIRVYLTLGDHAYGYDVTGYEDRKSDLLKTLCSGSHHDARDYPDRHKVYDD